MSSDTAAAAASTTASASAAPAPASTAAVAAPQTSRREEDEDEVDLNDDGTDEIDEAEIEAMKKRVAEMEAEAAKLREMTAAASSSNGGPSGNHPEGSDIAMSDEDKEAVDNRSVYVGNVDYGSTPEEIQAHFASCGTINRVTILCDKYTGPKGYAYVEFADPSLVPNAVLLNESMFRGRLLKVTPKRTNIPGMGAGAPRGRGRGRGRGYRGGYQGHGGFSPYGRGGRGRGGYRGRGAPY